MKKRDIFQFTVHFFNRKGKYISNAYVELNLIIRSMQYGYAHCRLSDAAAYARGMALECALPGFEDIEFDGFIVMEGRLQGSILVDLRKKDVRSRTKKNHSRRKNGAD